MRLSVHMIDCPWCRLPCSRRSWRAGRGIQMRNRGGISTSGRPLRAHLCAAVAMVGVPRRTIRCIARFWVLYLVPQTFLPIGDSVCEHDTNDRVKVETTPGGTADVEVDHVSQYRFVLGIFRSIQRRFWTIGSIILSSVQRHIDDGTCRIAPLPEECLRAWLHIAQVVRDKEQLNRRFIWIFDHDLELALLRDSITTAWRRLRGLGPSVLFLPLAYSSLIVERRR